MFLRSVLCFFYHYFHLIYIYADCPAISKDCRAVCVFSLNSQTRVSGFTGIRSESSRGIRAVPSCAESRSGPQACSLCGPWPPWCAGLCRCCWQAYAARLSGRYMQTCKQPKSTLPTGPALRVRAPWWLCAVIPADIEFHQFPWVPAFPHLLLPRIRWVLWFFRPLLYTS